MILTAEAYFRGISRPEARKRLRDRHLILNIEESNKTLRAEINHSRWLVNCPNCNNAEFLFSDKRFYCTECKNEGNGGKLYKVKMPRNKMQIETLLEPRPLFNRSWKYPETISDLADENRLHIKEMS